MNLEEIEIGMSESYIQVVRDTDVKLYAKVSGDYNPLHLDEEYAKKTQFKKKIAHGMISSSFFSRLFGTKLPGNGCVYVTQSLNFKRPVYINDEVTAIIKVTDINYIKRRIFFNTICKVNNKVVIDGKAELYLPKK